MSLNRNTKAYWSRVKKLAKEFRYPPGRTVDGKYRQTTMDEIIAEQPNGTPRRLIEDALEMVAEDSRRFARYSEESAVRDHAKAEAAINKLEQIRKPNISIVRAAK